MKKEKITQEWELLIFDKANGGGSIQKKECCQNCKLTYWNAVYGFRGTNAQKIASITEALKVSRIVVSFNTTKEDLVELLEENFELYSVSAIPVGYSGGMQYHICMRNPIGRHNENMRKSNYIKGSWKNKTKDQGVNKDKLKLKLQNLFKKRRRKADIIDDIINEI